jgi:periplasmic glucans biosynthesis protein
VNKYSLTPVVLLCLALDVAAQNEGSGFDFNALKNRAQNLAAAPYQASDRSLPEELQRFNYDDMRNVRFDPKAALWRMDRLPFQLQFVHRGGPKTDASISIPSKTGGRNRSLFQRACSTIRRSK